MDEQTASNQVAGVGCLALILIVIATPAAWFVVGPFALFIPLAVCIFMVWLTRKLASTVRSSQGSKAKIARAAKSLSDPNSPNYSYRGSTEQRPASTLNDALADAQSAAPNSEFFENSSFSNPERKINLGREISSGSSVLMFEYADANGVVTDRSISDWIEYRHHIRGFCLSAHDDRTFRKDRVLTWVLGENELKRP